MIGPRSRASLSRRDLLRALGVSAAAAPFVPLLDRTANAAAAPQRLLLVYSPNGTLEKEFWPTGTETSFTFAPGSILESLQPFAAKLLLPRNIKRLWHPLGGNHERGIGCLWTGARLNPGNQFGGGGYPSAPSVDQLIGRALPLVTDYRTLEVAVQNAGSGAAGDTMLHMVYAGSDQPIPPVASPYELFTRLTAGGVPASPADQTAARRLTAERQSVIDMVRAELTRVRPKIDREDAAKIDGHLDALRSVEMRLQRPAAAGIASGGKCNAMSPGAPVSLTANESFPALLKLQSDLLVSAFACDRTRVATLQWSRAFSEVRHTWAGVTGDHHSLSHDTSPSGIASIRAINRWYAQQFAYLLGQMQKVPEGNGTLLDNTLVVWANELNEGSAHRPSPVCVVMAGGLGGRVRVGRSIDIALQNDWNQMLVTIAQAMGVNMTTVGDLGGSGAIPGILA